MGTKKSEFIKAINWILNGRQIVKVNEEFVARIEKSLHISLKKLSHKKYLVKGKPIL